MTPKVPDSTIPLLNFGRCLSFRRHLCGEKITLCKGVKLGFKVVQYCCVCNLPIMANGVTIS